MMNDWRANGLRIETGPMVAGDGWAVAVLMRDGFTDEQVEQHKRLILAAPDLLAVADMVRIAGPSEYQVNRPVRITLTGEQYQHLCAAIAKAKP